MAGSSTDEGFKDMINILIDPHKTKMWRIDVASQTAIFVPSRNRAMEADGLYIRTQFNKQACEVWLSPEEAKSLYKWLGEQLDTM
jgi:hypothetical protein